ncbi:MAG: ribonuclease R [Muribaculaceae bacterium]|nr:ribonuclease R [Muribaculaceae bacterium]
MKSFQNKKGKTQQGLVTHNLPEAIDKYISEQKNNTFNYRQVSYALGVTTTQGMRAVAQYLISLASDGGLIEVSPGKYKAPARNTVVEATFVRRANGKNSIITEPDGENIFVAERNSMHALNGDKVKAVISARRRGIEPEAKVVEITQRYPQTFIGTVKLDRKGGILQTDSKFLATDIYLPRKSMLGAQNGDKAVVEIVEWPEEEKMPVGRVVDVLGQNGENDTEMHAILAEYGLPYSYPEVIEKEAEKIEAGITDDVVAKRVDMRPVTTFTIDPKDAKDFDDALSIRRLLNGNYEVGVHIADVTHYVKPDTPLDKEARKRATSVYLVDRVVPMLPEHLSNGICSLRPDEDKLAFSVIFEITPKGKVVNSRIVRTVIRSDRRFTYEEAQEVIESGHGDFAKEILTLDKLAKVLRKERYENGSVDFDRDEVRFELDENGHPISVYFKESKDANKLIEEFMLLANKTVAKAIGAVDDKKKAKPFVYRVHDMPEPGKLADLSALAKNFGYKVKTEGTPAEVNKSLNKLLEDVKGKGEENFLSTLAIRSMAKAIYTTENIGHYGLGFDYYTHFTSPIRRYPDMMVHRLLERYLSGGRAVNIEKLEEQCKHSSDMEQQAANAERSSIKYKQVEYMKDRLGEVYDGIITGVTEWGLYVELKDNKCEGLVPMRNLEDDYYDFDEKNHTLIGRRHGARYRLGDEIRVQVARAAVDQKQLDFVVVDDKNPARSKAELRRAEAETERRLQQGSFSSQKSNVKKRRK